MPKHNNAKMAQSLYVSQREEAACRAEVIKLNKELHTLRKELEKVTFDRNYWRDHSETQKQTIRLLQHQVAYKDGQIGELRSNLPRSIDDEGITINIHSGFNKP